MAKKTIYPYYVNDYNEAWVFSALNVMRTTMDFAEALSKGVITQEYHDALVLNIYGGDIKEKTTYWLKLT